MVSEPQAGLLHVIPRVSTVSQQFQRLAVRDALELNPSTDPFYFHREL